jgi:hypothetical protein
VPLRSLGLRHVSSAIFAGAIAIAPVAAKADDHHDKRYYDRNARDYHTLTPRKIARIASISASSIAIIASSTRPTKANGSGKEVVYFLSAPLV